MAFSALSLFFLLLLGAEALTDQEGVSTKIPLVKREDRKSLIVTEYGQVSAVEMKSGRRGPYHLHFITLDPNSLFLPVLLHSDMVFFVHTGSGKLSWVDDGKEIKRVNLRSGDVFRLLPGSVFFVQSNLHPEREKLRIYAIFTSAEEDVYEPSIGAYSAISDLVLGFDRKLLQSAFKAPEDVIEEIRKAERPAGIVHAAPTEKSVFEELEARLVNVLMGGGKDVSLSGFNSKSKKIKTFNIEEASPDFENCNGRSVTVDQGTLKSLKGSNVGFFMVNLTKGSMMGPHWNPMATEVSIVLHGQGMVRVVCASNASESECKSVRFKVKAGDVFLVPRFHPMTQMSFNNDSLVFMGFSTTRRRNYPQFLAGKRSVLQTLDNEILALSFNVSNNTIARFLSAQPDSIILDCTSCAEEEERISEEEIERKRQEEEARKREEESKRREEEEAKRREEEEREREEEEARKREEQEREREEKKEREKKEEKREREEEEEKKRREEEKKKKEEEEARRRKEKMEKEEEARMREEEERRREEKEEARREEEEEERTGEEEEAEREQKKAKRQEEKRQKQRKEEEETARRERERQEEGKAEEEEAKNKKQEQESDNWVPRRSLRKVWRV